MAQSKEIEINQLYRYIVPEGKVVELTNSKFYKIILSNGSFRSGTACNSAMHSNPSYIYGISYYENIKEDDRQAKTIGFTFQDIKHHYDDIYQVKPYFLLKDDMGMDDLRKSLNWKFSPQKIVFYPGMSVFPTSCVRSMMLTQRDMSMNEQKAYDFIKKKRLELKVAKEKDKTLQEEREKARVAQEAKNKFNNLSSVYTEYDVANVKDLKYLNTLLMPLLKALSLKLGTVPYDKFFKLNSKSRYQEPLYVLAQWDSLGIIKSLSLRENAAHGEKINIDLLSPDSNTVKLKQYLKLKNKPIAKLDGLQRYCNFQSYLLTLNYSIGDKEFFAVKKTDKKLIYTGGRHSTNRPVFEEAVPIDFNTVPNGRYEFYLFFVEYQFKSFFELFNDNQPINITEGAVFPASAN